MDNVTVYTSTSCHYCGMIKDYLKEKNVKFVEKNIDEDSEARAFLIKKELLQDLILQQLYNTKLIHIIFSFIIIFFYISFPFFFQFIS